MDNNIANKKILIILGPTATGKSDLSIAIAKKFNCEIISADSMQVYRKMNVGSGKIDSNKRTLIPHYLIDIIDPDQAFSVADFYNHANFHIEEIIHHNKLPLICGGTGLYINSLIFPYNFNSSLGSDLKIRKRLKNEFLNNGGKKLHIQLAKIDPISANNINFKDSRRLIRALEIYEITGEKPSLIKTKNQKVKYKPLLIGLTMERNKLYERINVRVDKMIENGLIQEVENLIQSGVSRTSVSMQGLGYKQIFAYLEGELELQKAIDLIKRDTRHFAKRQITWFKRDSRIIWFNIEKYFDCDDLINDISFYITNFLNEE